MPDGLYVPNIDFSPLRRANSLRTQSRQGALQVAGSALDLGQQLYGIFESRNAERARGEIADLERQEIEEWNRLIFQGRVDIDPETGKLVTRPEIIDEWMTEEHAEATAPDMDAWMDQRAEEIAGKYKNFPRLQEHIRAQAERIHGVNHIRAMEVATKKALEDTEAQFQQNYETGMQRAIAAGDISEVIALIKDTDWMPQRRKDLLLQQAEKQFELGQVRLDVRARAAQEGAEAVSADIDRRVQTGEFTPEQGDALKQEAAGAEATEINDITARAMQQYYPLAEEIGPDKALDLIMEGIPEPHRPDVRARLEAARNYIVRKVDDEANEEMQGFFAQNKDNPAAWAAHFNNPENNYSDRMVERTYMVWESRVRTALAGGDPDANKAAQEAEASRIAVLQFYTEREKRDMINDRITNPAVRLKFLKMDLNELADPLLSEGEAAISDMYTAILAGIDKDKDPEAWTEATHERDGLVNRFFEQIEDLDRKKDREQIRAALQEAIQHATQRYVAGQWSEAQLKPDTPLTINAFEDALRYLQGGGGRQRVLNAETVERVGAGTVIWLERFTGGKIDANYPPEIMPDGRTRVVINAHEMSIRYDAATKSVVAQMHMTDGSWRDIAAPAPARAPRPTMPPRGGRAVPVPEIKPLPEMTVDELGDALAAAAQSRNPTQVQEVRDEMDRRGMTEAEEETRLGGAIEAINQRLGEKSEEFVEGSVDWLKEQFGKAGRWFGRNVR